MLGQAGGYVTTSERGLRWDSVPMRLFQKAKKLGAWDPQDLDFSQDRRDWAGMSEVEKDFILRTIALFQAGEEAVTVDLLPLIMVIAAEGRIEEEIYLTSFLWEEAKHVEFFRRWLDEVAENKADLSAYMTPSYAQLFTVELPRSMNALLGDRSRAAQIRASTTYNMIIEGVLAETGYHGFRQSLQANGLMPGFLEGISLTARDESRHIRYGVFLLDRLVNEEPQGGAPGEGLCPAGARGESPTTQTAWEVMNERMNELFGPALAVIAEFWEHYDPDAGPFGQTMTTFVDFASSQFDKRMKVLERDRGKALAEIEKLALAEVEAL